MQEDKKKPVFPTRLRLRFFAAITRDEPAELRDFLKKNKGKIDPNIRTHDNQTPLLIAIDHMAGKRTLALLLASGADIEARDERGRTPLLLAIEKSASSAVEFLLKKKANIHAVDVEGNGVFHYMIDESGSRFGHVLDQELAEVLLKNGANINIANARGETPLHLAAQCADEHMLKTILSCRPDVNVRNNRDETPLHLAVDANTENGPEQLIAAGADINARNNQLLTPLHIAIQMNFEEAAFSLLDRGADPNARDRNGETPLHMAATESTLELIVALLKAGADPLAPSLEGVTPLDLSRLNDPAVDSAGYEVQQALTAAAQEAQSERQRLEREQNARAQHKINLQKIDTLPQTRRIKPPEAN